MRTVKVIILARDEMVGAFLREKIGALPCIEVATNGSVAVQGVVVDEGLLTFSERRVLQACADYDRLEEAAAALCITRDTVKKHLARIYRKLEVNSLHRALLRARELGLLDEAREGRERL